MQVFAITASISFQICLFDVSAPYDLQCGHDSLNFKTHAVTVSLYIYLFSHFLRICFKVFGHICTRSDMLGPVRTHSDTFGCIRMHSQVFGDFRVFKTNVQKI